MSPDKQDDYITRAEMQDFKADLKSHLSDLADSQTKVIDERFKAFWWRNLLALGVAVGLLRFDVPGPVTAGAIGLAVVSSLIKAASVIAGGKSL